MSNDVSPQSGPGRWRWVWTVIPVIMAIGVAGLVGWALAGSASRSSAAANPHAGANQFSGGQYQRILRATQTAGATSAAATLEAEGEQLFNSRAIAKPGLACADCHPGGGSAGARGIIVHPTKPGDFKGPRTAPALWNIARTAPYGWNGATLTLQAFSVRVIGNFFRDAATQPAAVTAHQAAALTAYMNTIVAPTTAFDTGLSGDALAGQAIFVQKCASCHTPPLFTDGKIHNIGVEQVDGAADPGSLTISVFPGSLTPGGFNTPQLRGVSRSGPYMHNGIFPTLDEVLKFYNGHSTVDGLKIPGDERKLLLAYLNSL